MRHFLRVLPHLCFQLSSQRTPRGPHKQLMDPSRDGRDGSVGRSGLRCADVSDVPQQQVTGRPSTAVSPRSKSFADGRAFPIGQPDPHTLRVHPRVSTSKVPGWPHLWPVTCAQHGKAQWMAGRHGVDTAFLWSWNRADPWSMFREQQEKALGAEPRGPVPSSLPCPSQPAPVLETAPASQ